MGEIAENSDTGRREMTEAQVRERLALNMAVTSESLRRRAAAGRAPTNGHGPVSVVDFGHAADAAPD